MSPQPDHAIDQVLTALRDTPTPTGLEARIAHRLLQSQTMPAQPRPFQFAVILGFAKDLRIQLAAATMLAMAITIPLAHHQPANWQPGNRQTENQSQATQPVPAQNPVILSEVPRPRGTQSKDLLAARTTTSAESLSATSSTPGDPDAIALAETLAPSQPTPPQPLTPQERLLFRATRPGQPIEVAELELAREPFRRASTHTHERFTFAQIAKGLLAPLAEAESIEPTTSSPDAAPVTEPPSY